MVNICLIVIVGQTRLPELAHNAKAHDERSKEKAKSRQTPRRGTAAPDHRAARTDQLTIADGDKLPQLAQQGFWTYGTSISGVVARATTCSPARLSALHQTGHERRPQDQPAQGSQDVKTLMMGCWQVRQRQNDITLLWPSLCNNTGDVEQARRAFGYHAARDNAWAVLPDEVRIRQINALIAPEGGHDQPLPDFSAVHDA